MRDRAANDVYLQAFAECLAAPWVDVLGLKPNDVPERPPAPFSIGAPVKVIKEEEEGIINHLVDGGFSGGIWQVSVKREKRELSSEQLQAYPEFPKLGVSLALLERLAQHPLVQANPDFTTADVCFKIVKPLTVGAQASLADVLHQLDARDEQGRPYTGEATLFLSHAWRYKFTTLLAALRRFVGERKPPEAVYVWYDIAVVNQHMGASLPQAWWSTAFRQGIGKIQHTVVVLSPWEDPKLLQRAWCLWEVLCTLLEDCPLSLALPPDEEAEFHEALRSEEGFKRVDAMLNKVDVKRAEVRALRSLRSSPEADPQGIPEPHACAPRRLIWPPTSR